MTLNITEFSFFYAKTATTLKKVIHFFSATPSKIEILSSPLLENLVGGSTPPPRKEWLVANDVIACLYCFGKEEKTKIKILQLPCGNIGHQKR